MEPLPAELEGFGAGGNQAEYRLQWPAGDEVSAPQADLFTPVPVAVGQSGNRYQGETGFRSGGDPTYRWRSGLVTFPGMTEPGARVELVALLDSEPRKVSRFRLTNIPLPLPPKALLPASGHELSPATPVAKTGSLSCRVLISGMAAGPGKLTVGVAARRGRGWGPVRWREAAVGAGGMARVDNLEPGTYRIVRKYATPPGQQGRWRGAETVATVLAGKEVPLPMLRFEPGER